MLNIVVQNQNYMKNKFVLLAAGAVLLTASVTTFVSVNECSVTWGSGYYACCGVGCSCVQG